MRKGIPVSARLPTMRAVVVNGMALIGLLFFEYLVRRLGCE